MRLHALQKQLRSLTDPQAVHELSRFFKTGKGEYGAGDRFLGIKVPVTRKLVRAHRDETLEQMLRILKSPYHEERLAALLLMVQGFDKGTEELRGQIYRAYLAHTAFINNWDLVDASAPKIIGPYLLDRSRRPLYTLAASGNLWERRIAIMATLAFIRLFDYEDSLRICRKLLHDEHDLIHKATGWMLREIGNRDRAVEEQFLRRYYRQMPRTMLRYAIEKFPAKLRRDYLVGKV